MSAIILRRLAMVASLSFLLFSPACQPATQPVNRPAMNTTGAGDWDAYVNQFIEDYFKSHPDFAARAGRHEFDGKLPDWSAAGFQAEAKRLHAEKDRLASFQDSTLDERQRFEREYVAWVIDSELFWIESAQWPFRCPQYYADSIDPDVYVSRPYAPLDQRLKAYITSARP